MFGECEVYDIHKLIQQNFPSESISTVEASRIIKEAFRSSQSKYFTHGNWVFGVQLKVPPVSSTSPTLSLPPPVSSMSATLSLPLTDLNVDPVPPLLTPASLLDNNLTGARTTKECPTCGQGPGFVSNC